MNIVRPQRAPISLKVPTNSMALIRLACILAVVLLGLAVYANSLDAPFIFDGLHITVPNLTQLTDWSLSSLFRAGESRPLTFLTFAANYAWGGLDVRGYHVVNLTVHILAALALMGIVRRTLELPGQEFATSTTTQGLALVCAAIWLVHPLETQSVTYVYQRYESLAGLFYLLTLYAFVRSFFCQNTPWWQLGSVIACACGMACKETMVTAPLLVLWFDRVFVSRSWRKLFVERWKYYVGLAGSWGVLALVMASHTDYSRAGVFQVEGLSPLQYAANQTAAILHYLQLTFWPTGLCLDPAWPTRDVSQLYPAIAVMVGLLGVTLALMYLRPRIGFLLGTFFLLLAPTSSVAPIVDLMFEHRMYVALAPLVVCAVIVGYLALKKLLASWDTRPALKNFMLVAPAVAVILALSLATVDRNRDYASELSIWRDTALKAPHNSRAHYNLGRCYAQLGDVPHADEAYRQSIKIDPDKADAHNALGELLTREARWPEAQAEFERATALQPGNADAQGNLANLLAMSGQPQEAIKRYRIALAKKATDATMHRSYAQALAQLGQWEEAEQELRTSMDLAPNDPQTVITLGAVYAEQGKKTKARKQYQQALRLQPRFAAAHYNLGTLLISEGKLEEAYDELELALKYDPNLEMAELALRKLRILLQR